MENVYKLSNGLVIPKVGFGTWRTPEGDVAYQSVLEALKVGYRHIDTAKIYGNEQSVGQAIKDSGIKREELFITTKLWNDAHGYKEAKAALDHSLQLLNLDYVDLYLIHWPNPVELNGKWQEANQETWRAMEEAVKEGKIKSIGVSNFMKHHIKELLKTATIKPVANQIRLAPGVYQSEVVDYCREQNILLEAWSPLGQGEIFENETMQKLAKKYNKTIAQIALAWSLQEGFLPLPKSVTPSRIAENFDCQNIVLTSEDMQLIRHIQGVTQAPDPDHLDF